MLADYNTDQEEDENGPQAQIVATSCFNVSLGRACHDGAEEPVILHLHNIIHQPIMNFTEEEQLRIEFILQIERDSRINFFQALQEYNSTTLRRFVTSILSGNLLEFSVTCCGYVCGLLKLIRCGYNYFKF